jgi:hypothetical protein
LIAGDNRPFAIINASARQIDFGHSDANPFEPFARTYHSKSPWENAVYKNYRMKFGIGKE